MSFGPQLTTSKNVHSFPFDRPLIRRWISTTCAADFYAHTAPSSSDSAHAVVSTALVQNSRQAYPAQTVNWCRPIPERWQQERAQRHRGQRWAFKYWVSLGEPAMSLSLVCRNYFPAARRYSPACVSFQSPIPFSTRSAISSFGYHHSETKTPALTCVRASRKSDAFMVAGRYPNRGKTGAIQPDSDSVPH